MTQRSGVNGKTIAIISYLTFIGWIIGYILNTTTKSSLAAFHLRQYLGIMLMGVVLGVFSRMLPSLSYLALGILILWVFGFIAAINGEEKPIPLVGAYFQDWFKSL